MTDDTTAAAEAEVRRATRFGMILFLLYLALYAGFVGIATFRPALMGVRPFGGVNLAIWYGMVLIVAPLVLAGIYLVLCRRRSGA
ncbi:MAG: DUF485 domain-containing protein [Planctomycetes bacterium]|nr:DUF485 domain-containing protein [Planctomycetota bacterium]